MLYSNESIRKSVEALDTNPKSRSIKQVFKYLNGADSDVRKITRSVAEELVKYNKKNEDANEFLIRILTELSSYVHGYTTIQQNDVYCTETHTGQRKERNPQLENIFVTDLQLTNSITNSIQESIDAYTKVEKLVINVEDLCVSPFESYKKITIYPDKTLFVSLKRFLFGTKLKFLKNKCEVNWIIQVSDKKYRLKGCCIYTGSGSTGHYVYLLFQSEKKGLVFNDTEVTPLDLEVQGDGFVRVTYSAPIEKHGYIFMYEQYE